MSYFNFKIAAPAIAVICAFSPIAAKDATVKTAEGISVTYALNGTEGIARVKSFTETMKTKITIPSTIKVDGVTYTVTKIGAGAFKNADFTTIVLPNTITLIEKEAFAGSWVKKCNIPTKVEAIKANAFHDTHIGSAHIPSTCTEIGDYAFENANLSKLTFEEGFRDLTIGIDAFCGNNLTELSLPYRVSSVGDGAFCHTDIVNLVWSSKLTVIPARCFYHCDKLRSVKIWLGVTRIGERAFAETFNLTSLEMPTSLATIDRYAFNRSGLTSVVIPEGMTSLSESVFESCTSLRSVHIPSTMKSIGQTCFQGDEAITSVTCDALVPPVCASSVFANAAFNAVLTVPQSAWRAYYEADTWWRFDFSKYAGVECVTDDINDGAPAEYFDLNGNRIPGPQPGRICIVRRNGKATIMLGAKD